MSVRAVETGDSPTSPPPKIITFWSWAGASSTDEAVSVIAGLRSPGTSSNLFFCRFQIPGVRPTTSEPYPELAPE